MQYMVICKQTAADLALQWAERAPCVATGSLELRPVMPPMGA